MPLNLKYLIDYFLKSNENNITDLTYNEFGLQFELGIFLRNHPAIKNKYRGENGRTYINDGKTYAEVRVNELALIYWALQYGHGVEVLAPQSTRDKIKSAVFKLAEKYK